MKVVKNILSLSIVSVFLTSCSYYTDLYIINKREREVMMTIELTSDLVEVEKIDYQLELKYSDSILKVDDNTKNQLDRKIKYETVDSKTIRIELPPKSTILLGGGFNGLPKQFKTFSIEKSNMTESLSSKEMEAKAEQKKKSSSPFHFVYVIE